MFATVRSTAFALCLAAVIPPATAADGVPPPSLLGTIELWLEVNFGLPPSKQSPLLATVSASRLVEIRYGAGSTVSPGEVVAAYDDLSRTIYLPEGWTGRTPAQLSLLVHEMVHHLQASAGMRFACPGEREVLAYRAQDAWLGLFGMDLESALGDDPTMLLVTTVCTH